MEAYISQSQYTCRRFTSIITGRLAQMIYWILTGKHYIPTQNLGWNNTVGSTGIKFFDSDKMGQGYKNDMFVGDFHNGNLYHFDLDKDRRELAISG